MVDSGFQDNDSLLATSRGGVISARGTNDGVTLRLDGRIAEESLKTALSEFMKPRKSFLGGQEVSLEWVGVRPQGSLVDEVTKILCDEYGVAVRASKLKETAATVSSLPSPMTQPAALQTSSTQSYSSPSQQYSSQTFSSQTASKESRSIAEKRGSVERHDNDEIDFSALDDETPPSLGLFSGLGDIKNAPTSGKEKSTQKSEASAPLADPSLWDHPDARIIYSTLRSGQRIDSEHTVVIVGDVNPGAEIMSGGDVIVLGSLRGIAHAGAYDETGGGRTIFALCLQPTQLRIGATLSRGSTEGGKVPEIARIEGNMIVVEPFMKKVTPRKWSF
jgi:septum formation inhibitor MinC